MGEDAPKRTYLDMIRWGWPVSVAGIMHLVAAAGE
jgi:hypothetical protein